jgi:hypothetical protein
VYRESRPTPSPFGSERISAPLRPISARKRSYSSIARAEVRRRREPQVAPLGFDDRGSAKCLSWMFDDDANNAIDLGERRPGGTRDAWRHVAWDYIGGAPVRPMRVLRTVKSIGFVR